MIKAFEASLVPNNETLLQAKNYLESIKSCNDVIQSSLSIALSSSPLEIRQVSVIYLKNLTKVWKDSRRDFIIPEADKLFLKANIIKCLLFSIPDKIRSQFEEIAFNIAKTDFPWNEIIVQIEECLISKDADLIYAGLSMINQISKVYEQVLNERRNNMKIIVSKFFCLLGSLLESLLTEENETKFRYISLILEIYWTCFYIDLPEEQANIEALQGWLYKCKVILEMPVGDLDRPLVREDEARARDEHPIWVCKKWCSQIIHRFFNRYFNLNYLKDQNRAIGEYFQSTWALPLTELALQSLLKLPSSYIPNSVTNYLLKFITQAFKLSSTQIILNKYNVQIINACILPLLHRKPSDEDLWLNDPIEYIQKENDVGKAYYSSKSSAIDLLITMCENSCLSYFITIMLEIFKSCPSFLVKESLIYAFGCLNKVIKTEKTLLESVEMILFKYALPEFTSPIGFLRSRACWVYSLYADIDYKANEHKETVFNHVCRLMLDPELPVRIEAATSLPKLLDWEVSQSKISTEIKSVLSVYLGLMNEIDFEDLVESLESIVENFSSDIVPFAIELVTNLAQKFVKLASKNSDESAVAATSTLNTLSKIIDILDDRPEDLLKISVELQQVFDYVFTLYGNDYFETGLGLLGSLLYYCPHNSLGNLFKYANLIKLYIIENNKIRDLARDFIEEIFAPLANYLKKYKTLSKENIGIFIEISSVLALQGYQETVTGCKIFMAILENIPLDISILKLVLLNSYPVYTAQDSKKIKMLFVQILFISFWRAPEFTLSYLNSLACFENIFKFISENYIYIKEEIPLIQAIFGMSSLLSISNNLPEYKELFIQIYHIVLHLFHKLTSKKNTAKPYGQEPEYLSMLNKLKNAENEEYLDEFGAEMYESLFEGCEVKGYLKKSLEKFSYEIALTPEEHNIINYAFK